MEKFFEVAANENNLAFGNLGILLWITWDLWFGNLEFWPLFAKISNWIFVINCKDKFRKRLLLQKVYLTSVLMCLSMLSSRFTNLNFLSSQTSTCMFKVNIKNTGKTCWNVFFQKFKTCSKVLVHRLGNRWTRTRID